MSIADTYKLHKHTWVQTASGLKVDPFAPDRRAIRLRDVAHHLALLCRFNGATSRDGAPVLYSVGQHSVIVSLIATTDKPGALLHDTPEYSFGDVVAPLKHRTRYVDPACTSDTPLYATQTVEETHARFAAEVGAAFGIHPDTFDSDAVRRADLRCLHREKLDFMVEEPASWNLPPADPVHPDDIEGRWRWRVFEGRTGKLRVWDSPVQTMALFLERAFELGIREVE